MYKLKDVIASRGKNPKINKALDRYELSKDEKKDIINTIKNVQQGGGDVPSGGGSNIEYLDVRGADPMLVDFLSYFVTAARTEALEVVMIGSGMVLGVGLGQGQSTDSIKYLAVDKNGEFIINNKGAIQRVIFDDITKNTQVADLYNAIPRITKEEFYNLQ